MEQDGAEPEEEPTYARFFKESGIHLVRLAYLLLGNLAEARTSLRRCWSRSYDDARSPDGFAPRLAEPEQQR